MSKLRKVIFVIALLAFLISAGILVTHYVKGYLEQKDFDDLSVLKTTEQKGLKTSKGVVLGKYVKLYKKNKDIIGWIKINGTKVDYPVMQTKKDPEFYLRRNFKKKYKVSGTPFMAAESDIFKPTSNWMIYGHNMKNGTMFEDVVEYQDQSFYEKHKLINFDTIYEEGLYEVVAAFPTQLYPEKDKTHFKYYAYPAITSQEEFDEYIRGVKSISTIDTGITPQYGDQLITLSTCSYHTEDPDAGRFGVVARAIDMKQYYLKKVHKLNRMMYKFFGIKR